MRYLLIGGTHDGEYIELDSKLEFLRIAKKRKESDAYTPGYRTPDEIEEYFSKRIRTRYDGSEVKFFVKEGMDLHEALLWLFNRE